MSGPIPTMARARSVAQRLRQLPDLAARSGARPVPALVDGALALGFLAAMLVERAGSASAIGGRMPAAVLLSTVIAGTVALRRTAPLLCYLAGSVALSAEALFVLPSTVSPYANLICLYSLGLHATRGRARWGPGIVLLGMGAYFTGRAHTRPDIPAGVLFLWLLAWAYGYGTARRQEEREAGRLLLRQRVVAEERARIARELHDLVGHTLNVMLVQAGAARRLLDRGPEQTRELLTGMEHTGREALDELDRVLGLLRHGGPNLQPGLAELATLTGRMEQAGIRVSTRIDPAAHRVPRSVDMSAYRIVQEALTNSVKHGRAGSAEITVRRHGDVLDIEVRDDGLGVVGVCTPGRGLLGIGERVSVFGGSVEHGGVQHEGGERGGFRVRALLPIPR